MTLKRARLEVQIRQNNNDVPTNAPDVDADTTVVSDTFEGALTGLNADTVRVYVDDDHDEAIDVDVEHTHTSDTDFSRVLNPNTISLTSGGSKGTKTISGPVGALRLNILASDAAAAPTTGTMIVEVIAHG